jgi:hypothetical protein
MLKFIYLTLGFKLWFSSNNNKTYQAHYQTCTATNYIEDKLIVLHIDQNNNFMAKETITIYKSITNKKTVQLYTGKCYVHQDTLILTILKCNNNISNNYFDACNIVSFINRNGILLPLENCIQSK